MSREVTASAILVATLMCAFFAFGCATESQTVRTASKEGRSLAGIGKSIRGSLNKSTTASREVAYRRWAAGIPTGGERADSIAVTVPDVVVARFCPELGAQDRIQLASGTTSPPPVEIVNVNGSEVRTLADLISATDESQAPDGVVQVDFSSKVSRRRHVAAELNRSIVNRITQVTANENSVVVLTRNGRSSFLLREGPVRMEVTGRIERSSGTLHLAITSANHWGEAISLPEDVRVRCGNKETRCLSVAEALERVYGTEPATDTTKATRSYLDASASDLYRVPANYRNLAESQMAPDSRRFTTPAFVDAEEIYPGPPMLADARALAGFMRPPSRHEAGDPAETVWLVFGDDEFKSTGTVTVGIDLQGEEIPLRFVFPDLASTR